MDLNIQNQEEDYLFEEEEVEVKKQNIAFNPTFGLNPNEYEIGFTINGIVDTCTCGKEIQSYYIISQKDKLIKDDYGRKILDEFDVPIRKRSKLWEYKNYPELHCHCKCGKAWEEHLIK